MWLGPYVRSSCLNGICETYDVSVGIAWLAIGFTVFVVLAVTRPKKGPFVDRDSD